MASSSVVRLGPTDNNPGAELLRNAIVSFFRAKASDDDNRTSEDDSSRVVVRNKYFSAGIRFRDIEDRPRGEGGAEDEDEASKTEPEDGIVLVFDAARSNPDRSDARGDAAATTFDSLEHAHRKSISNDACGDLLRLCVGVGLAELSPTELRGKDHEKEYSRRILWCLDNGYEYIEADLSADGRQRGHDDRDKDGFARIIEAIEGTVWSSAAMSASRSSELKDAMAESKEQIQEPKAGGSSLVSETSGDTESDACVPPDPSLPLPATPNPEDEAATSSTGKPDASSETKDSVASVLGLSETQPGMDREEAEADKLFVQMENVLKEASQIRKASKSGALTDEERRERAGDAALALVNLMGRFGLDENDDEGYGSDDSGIVDSD
mmetsp:Transcript_17772/g.36554  ORF Transcript_17772/g.36554 Transcript_17772/m.36554 type:complete len:382 (+) Transcript_17772:111-1256(+)